MPELPDVTVYVERMRDYIAGHPLENVRIQSPFLLRTVDPSPEAVIGQVVETVERLGKRIVIGFGDERFAVVHLMIAGRFRWRERGISIARGNALAAFDFPNGSLLLTEASKKKRASLHIMQGRASLASLDRGGLEVLGVELADFRASLVSENHTLKRALTDPRIFSGIGNAYSDEILLHARLSPFKQTRSLDESEVTRLFNAVRNTLNRWTDEIRAEVADGFPEKVTAFRQGMAVHGRYKKPCLVCGSAVQRIVYAENESNYCATCQTEGRVLADRSLSRLLKKNWPKTIDELENQAS